MDLDVFGLFTINALYVFIGIIVLLLIAIILSIIAIAKSSKMKKKYNAMMEGSNGKSIEKLIKSNLREINGLIESNDKNTEAIRDIYEKMQFVVQKVGVVKYDAFHEMGGKLSFALCMLDRRNNGYVVNVMHSNNGCFAYIKEIVNGESYIELGDEEAKAVSEAMAGGMGDVNLNAELNDELAKDVDMGAANTRSHENSQSTEDADSNKEKRKAKIKE